MNLLLTTLSLSNNSLGRAHSLYLAARAAGHTVSVVTMEPGKVWTPLAGTEFATLCRHVDEGGLREAVRDADVVIAVKPMPESAGAARRLCRELRRPLLVDVDDPDLSVGLNKFRQPALAWQYRADVARLVAAEAWARWDVSTVSNPVLQRRYGGEIVPHARPDQGPGRPHTSSTPVVAFVGTAWGHKGIATLRGAIASLADRGWTLVVTGSPPDDAAPWERWVGNDLTTEEGMSLVAHADVVALPSEPWGYGKAQLPMKLIDAMLYGRAVAVSDLEPLRWGMGDGGIVFQPGSAPALASALVQLEDPQTRTRLGERARLRALAHFTPEAVAPALSRSIDRAVRRRRRLRPVSSPGGA